MKSITMEEALAQCASHGYYLKPMANGGINGNYADRHPRHSHTLHVPNRTRWSDEAIAGVEHGGTHEVTIVPNAIYRALGHLSCSYWSDWCEKMWPDTGRSLGEHWYCTNGHASEEKQRPWTTRQTRYGHIWDNHYEMWRMPKKDENVYVHLRQT